jgi:hypothetical protein
MFELLTAAGLYRVVHCDPVVAFSSPMSPGVTLAPERDEIQLRIFARCEIPFGEPPSSTSCRRIDTVSHRAASS